MNRRFQNHHTSLFRRKKYYDENFFDIMKKETGKPVPCLFVKPPLASDLPTPPKIWLTK